MRFPFLSDNLIPAYDTMMNAVYDLIREIEISERDSGLVKSLLRGSYFSIKPSGDNTVKRQEDMDK